MRPPRVAPDDFDDWFAHKTLERDPYLLPVDRTVPPAPPGAEWHPYISSDAACSRPPRPTWRPGDSEVY